MGDKLKPRAERRITKIKGDIAEQAATLEAMKRGWGVLQPVGDRLPYDLVFDINGTLFKIQVKSAWPQGDSHVVDSRMSKTNRKRYLIERYDPDDFDVFLAYVPEEDIFYVMPIEVFVKYRSNISLETFGKRPGRALPFRNGWHLLEECASL